MKLRGRFTLKVDVDQLAEQVADALAGRLADRLPAAGSPVYERTEQEPAGPVDAAGFAVSRNGAVDAPEHLGADRGQG